MSTSVALPAPSGEFTWLRGQRPAAEDREAFDAWIRFLLVQAQEAGLAERQRLMAVVVESHLWLARSLARRFAYGAQDYDDLTQVACLALVQACHRFDPERSPFVAFAVPTITGTLQRHLRDHSWSVRPPRQTQELALKVSKQWGGLAQQLGAVPDNVELARRLGKEVSVDQVREAWVAAAGRSSTSLDQLPSNATCWVAPSEQEAAASEARLLLHRAWQQLSPQDQELLRLRFYDEQSQATIAAAFGVSQMQISRRLTRVLTALRAAIGEVEDEFDLAGAA